ncbi:hypothetical protein [Flavobacterium sp.]|uniref:hypothetical protein n=1 Tax=Flavobacterium sp. TaxID=239 RepID=UPI002619A083|nr:hypothetical protein [Flavobacterium sp.]
MKYKPIIGSILVWISYVLAFLMLTVLLQSLKDIFIVFSKEDNSYAFGYLMGTLIGYSIFIGIIYFLYSFGKKLKKQ